MGRARIDCLRHALAPPPVTAAMRSWCSSACQAPLRARRALATRPAAARMHLCPPAHPPTRPSGPDGLAARLSCRRHPPSAHPAPRRRCSRPSRVCSRPPSDNAPDSGTNGAVFGMGPCRDGQTSPCPGLSQRYQRQLRTEVLASTAVSAFLSVQTRAANSPKRTRALTARSAHPVPFFLTPSSLRGRSGRCRRPDAIQSPAAVPPLPVPSTPGLRSSTVLPRFRPRLPPPPLLAGLRCLATAASLTPPSLRDILPEASEVPERGPRWSPRAGGA